MSSPYPQTKIAPWQHQIDGFNLAKNHNNFYYAWDMGAGKTKGAIDFANASDAKTILVISPRKVIPVWPGQFRKHSYNDYNVLSVTEKLGNSIKKAKEIYNHIKVNKGDSKITKAKCIEAIKMIRAAALRYLAENK